MIWYKIRDEELERSWGWVDERSLGDLEGGLMDKERDDARAQRLESVVGTA